jgi:hypothetical protein
MDARVSVVTLTEIYYKYLQDGKPDLAKTRTQELGYATYLRKLDVNEDVAVKASKAALIVTATQSCANASKIRTITKH